MYGIYPHILVGYLIVYVCMHVCTYKKMTGILIRVLKTWSFYQSALCKVVHAVVIYLAFHVGLEHLAADIILNLTSIKVLIFCSFDRMDKGVIVYICDSQGVRDIYEADGADTIAASEPLVVLVWPSIA
jgi:hypothetical protein